MDRVYAFRGALLVLALSLGFASVAPPAARAQEGSVVPGKPFTAKILDYDQGQRTIKFDGSAGTLFIAPAQWLVIEKDFRDRIVKVGEWAEVVPNDEYKIVSIKATTPPTTPGGGQQLAGKAAQNAAFFQKCNAGDKIVIELNSDPQGGGVECFFDRYFQNQVYYTVVSGGSRLVNSIREVRDARLIAAGASVPTGGTAVPEVRPGEWYRVDDEFYGLCIRNVPNDFFVLELWPSGMKQTFSWATHHKIEKAERPAIGSSASAGTGGGIESPPLPNDVVVTAAPPDPTKQLDWNANVYRIPAKIRHSFEGKILINPKIEAGYKGGGTYLSPEAEKQALKQLGPLTQTEGVVWINEIKHYYERNENGEVLIAELGGNAAGNALNTPPAAIFPGIDTPMELQVNLRNAEPTDPPRARYDKTNLIAYTDPRAIPHLVKTFNDGNTTWELKERVLGAFAKSGNKDVLPFLLYKLYLNDDPVSKEAAQVKQAIASMRDSAGAEKYLIELIRDGGYKNEFTVPTAAGSTTGPTEKLRAPANPNDMLARIIELLELMQSDRAAKYVLAFIRSPDTALRDASRNFFLHRGTGMVGPLVWLTLSPLKDLAKEMLRDIALANPDCIWAWLRDVKQVKDAAYEGKRGGQTQDDLAESDLTYVIVWAEKNKDNAGDDDDIARAREVLSRIAAARDEVNTLKTGLSLEYSKQALSLSSTGPTSDVRPKRARLLQRAILLNPNNNDAREALARVYLEVASEMREGAPLRSGPGDVYRILRYLKVGEILTPQSSPEEFVAPEWRYVKGEDGTQGWAHSSVLKDGKTTLGVNHLRSPIKYALKYIELARALATDRMDKIESAFADMTATQADEAANSGDADAAYEAWKVAAANAPGKYGSKLFFAYLSARPLVPGVGLLALVAFLIAAFVHPKPPRVLAALPEKRREKGESDREKDAEPASGTRKVPS